MSDLTRQCRNCRFFQSSQLAGNGWCTHPKRQMASEVKLLVRERELGCRNSWGDDLFIPQASSHTTTPVSHRGLTVQASKTGDQVTSVSTSDGLPTLPAAEDVVTHTAVRPDGGTRSTYKHPALDHNAGAIA